MFLVATVPLSHGLIIQMKSGLLTNSYTSVKTVSKARGFHLEGMVENKVHALSTQMVLNLLQEVHGIGVCLGLIIVLRGEEIHYST